MFRSLLANIGSHRRHYEGTTSRIVTWRNSRKRHHLLLGSGTVNMLLRYYTSEALLGNAVFSVRSYLRLYNENQWNKLRIRVCRLLKSQRLQNKVLRTIGNFPRRTPVRELHVAFNILYVYDCITKLCRQQAEVI
jgi:hypothetical protein